MEQSASILMKDIKVEVPSASSLNSSTDSEDSSSKRSAYTICVTIIDLVNHVLIICLTIFLTYCTVARPFSMVDLHIALCTWGYILLMSEGIVVLAGESILTNFLTRRAKTHGHWILQILGLICIVAGVVVMFRLKTVHFRSIHAQLGIASTIIAIFVSVCGYPVFIAAKLRNLIRPVIIKFAHNLLGICSLVLGMASQCYGYKYGWPSLVTNIPHIDLVCTIVTALITILSLRAALPTLCHQLKAIFR